LEFFSCCMILLLLLSLLSGLGSCCYCFLPYNIFCYSAAAGICF
jgi:hypothetical protein